MRERDPRRVQRLAREDEQRREVRNEAFVAEPDERVIAMCVQLVPDDREPDRREVRADLVLAAGDERAADNRGHVRAALLDAHARDRLHAAGPGDHPDVRQARRIAGHCHAQRDVEHVLGVPRRMPLHEREVLLRDGILLRERTLQHDGRFAIACD